jgi:glycosyltransferase involved in cell wall biosynthesis
MRVVIISDGFTEKMGYSDNLLGKALATLGVDVHIITSDLTLNLREDASLVSRWIGEAKTFEPRHVYGYTVHTLPHVFRREGVYMRGLAAKLAELKPDIVQCIILTSWSTWQAYAMHKRLGFRFFLEEHTHWSVFKLHPEWKRAAYSVLYGRGIGRWLNEDLELNYCLGADCQRIAVDYYGIDPQKAILTTHGSDTEVFHPARSEAEHTAAAAIRARYEIVEHELLCLYTGRFTAAKNPILLAEAVASMRSEGVPIRGLFVGWGDDAAMARLAGADGCSVHPFVEWWQLADYYRAADVAVWPREESLSQLDALASGIPLVLNDQVGVPERAEGSGLLYRDYDLNDLKRVLLELTNPARRIELGTAGLSKAERSFAWRTLAQQRIDDYEQSLRKRINH